MANFQSLQSRRGVLRSLVGGSLLMRGIVGELLAAESFGSSKSTGSSKNVGPSKSAGPVDPLVAKSPHYAPKAKRVIFLFSTGGVAHMETFDPKPALIKADGKTL